MKPGISHGHVPNSERPAGARNKISGAKREKRRQEAEARQVAYDKLTFEQRIVRMNSAFGQGVGAQRERTRIAAAMVTAEKKEKTEALIHVKRAEKKAAVRK